MTVENLYEEIKRVFKELTGKENYKIYNSVYFIPTLPIFRKRLQVACKEYNMTDIVKIRDILVKYVKEKVEAKFPKYTKSLQYFIYGQNGKSCNLADEYFNQDVLSEEEVEKLGKLSNKDLFG
jgi:hypothetical protein